MKTPLITLVPLILTVGLVGWLLSGWLGAGRAEPAPAKPTRIDPALLAPRFADLPARDPFVSQDSGTAVVATAPAAPATNATAISTTSTPPASASTRPGPEAVAAAPRGVSPSAGPAARPTSESTAPKAEPRPSAIGRAVAAAVQRWQALTGQAREWARASEEFQAEVSAEVRLSATSLRGRARAAILNGRYLAEGQTVPGVATTRGPVILARVGPNSVLLRCRGASAVVAFPRHSLAATSAGNDHPLNDRPAPASLPSPARGPR